VVVGVLGLPKVMVTEYIIFVYKVGLASLVAGGKMVGWWNFNIVCQSPLLLSAT